MIDHDDDYMCVTCGRIGYCRIVATKDNTLSAFCLNCYDSGATPPPVDPVADVIARYEADFRALHDDPWSAL